MSICTPLLFSPDPNPTPTPHTLPPQYEEAVKRDPTNAPFRNNLAAAYLKMCLYNDAKVCPL